MEKPLRKLDNFSVQSATDRAKTYSESYIRRSLEFLTDSRKKDRLKKSECRWCFYFRSDRLGGAAMTNWYCGVCEKEGLSGSTACPRVCLPCGEAHKLCVECAGDLHMRVMRKFEPSPDSGKAGG